MEKETSNLLENAVRFTRKLPSGKVKLGLLCNCGVRLRDCGKMEEGRDVFREARAMLADFPDKFGRKYSLDELIMASAALSLVDDAKALAAELERIFDEEAPSPFRWMTAGLVIRAWVTLRCPSEVDRLLEKLPPEQRAKNLEIAILQAESVGQWSEVLRFLADGAMTDSFDEIGAELLLRLSRSGLPLNKRAAIMNRIVELSETAV